MIVGSITDGELITVNQPLEYQSKFTITCANGYVGEIPQAAVAKPKKLTGATENLGIRAETMISKGHLANVAFNDQGTIRCRVFHSANDILDGIIDGLSSNKRVSEHIVDTFTTMRYSQDFHTIPWSDKVSISERNELGKYVGELLVGVHALSGQLDVDVTSFAVPISSNFAGVDSFFIVDTKDNQE